MNGPGVRAGLVRRHVGGFNAWQFAVGAASPMAALVGGIPNTYAATGNLGVPLSFPLLGAALAIVLVGFLALTRRAGHAAPAYAFLALGLGPAWGIAFGVLAFVVNNAIQISLYGLLGATLAGMTGAGGWLVWALAAWLAVAVFGVANFSLGKVFVAAVGVAEIVAIVALILAAFTHPAGGHISASPMAVSALWDAGGQIGGVFAFGIAAFVGIDAAAVYAEEGKTDRTMVYATVGALAFLPVLYGLAAWALAVWTGPDDVVVAAQQASPTGFPLNVITVSYGELAGTFAQLLVLSSLFISALAFHNVIGRYTFAAAREQIIPTWFAQVGRVGGRWAGATAPASVLQSAIALIVVFGSAVLGVDPIAGLFTWLSSGAAVGFLVVLVAVCFATVFYFRAGHSAQPANVLVRTGLPITGAVIGSVLVLIITANQSTLLRLTHPGLQAAIPAAVAVALVAGFLYARHIRVNYPDRYAAVGHGRPDVLTTPDHQVGFHV